MPVPDFQSFFKPILDIPSDGQEHSSREARQKVAFLMQLSESDLSESLPSGNQTKFENRISRTISYFVLVPLYYGDFLEGSLSIGSRRG